MKISIITINFNNKEGLIKTVNSVINQTYKDIEYIIIDGASTDGSARYIKENKEDFDYWVSELDKGIYNAMNKGIDQATGEYLLFLNSGDYLAANDVIEKFVGFEPVEDIVYGDIWKEFDEKRKELKEMPKVLDIGTILNFVITHQAIFHKKTLFTKESRYDEKYTIVADWVFYNKAILQQNKSYRKIDLIIANYDMNGFSSSPSVSTLMEDERMVFLSEVSKKNFPILLKQFGELQSNYNGLLSSGTVKVALKISAMLNKIKYLV